MNTKILKKPGFTPLPPEQLLPMYQNKTQLTGGEVIASPQRDPFGTKRTANIAGRNYQPGGFHLKYALACILFTVQMYGKKR